MRSLGASDCSFALVQLSSAMLVFYEVPADGWNATFAAELAISATHKAAVIAAMDAGEEIAPEVLADYPQLQAGLFAYRRVRAN